MPVNEHVMEISNCWKCPCHSDCCIPCCGLNRNLYFEHVDTEHSTHPECPLKIKKRLLVYVRKVTPPTADDTASSTLNPKKRV